MNGPRGPGGPDIDRMRAAVAAQVFRRAPKLHDDDVVAGRYRLLEKIGSGSMATVWRARDERDHALVALKLLRSRELFAGQAVSRMLREAELAAAVVHPNVVRVLACGHNEACGAYLVMELIEGESLEKLMQREGPLPWGRARLVLLQIADALAAAHACGVVHRDLKPANVLVFGNPAAPDCKVIDFGLARPTGVDPSTGKLTGTGLVFGTPRYMSPEQVRAGELDGRADVYAFGCLAYELVTGHPAAASAAIGEVLLEHLSRHPSRFAEVAPDLEIPAGVEAIVRRATRKDRALRFASMDELRVALLAVDRGELVDVPAEELLPLSVDAEPVTARAHGGINVAVLVVLLVMLLLFAVALGAYQVIA